MTILYLLQQALPMAICLKGISRKGNLASTETILIRGKSRTIRKIQSIHYLDDLYKILNI